MFAKALRTCFTRPGAPARTYATLRGTSGSRLISRRKPPPERVVFRDELPGYQETETASESINNSLLSPVHIPEDPNGVLKSSHPATRILDNSALVIQRQLELGNLLL